MAQGVGLCHGISGNAYCLLAWAHAAGDRQVLRRAQRMALYAAQHWRTLYEVPDRPASLYEVRGTRRAPLWHDVLQARGGA